MLLLHVDDEYLASNHSDRIVWLCQELFSRFEMTNLGFLSYSLGMEFIQRPTGLILTQRGYLQQILTKFGMSHCNPACVPVKLGINVWWPNYSSTIGPNLTSLTQLLYSVIESLLLPRNPISLLPNIFFATSRAFFLWISNIVEGRILN